MKLEAQTHSSVSGSFRSQKWQFPHWDKNKAEKIIQNSYPLRERERYVIKRVNIG